MLVRIREIKSQLCIFLSQNEVKCLFKREVLEPKAVDIHWVFALGKYSIANKTNTVGYHFCICLSIYTCVCVFAPIEYCFENMANDIGDHFSHPHFVWQMGESVQIHLVNILPGLPSKNLLLFSCQEMRKRSFLYLPFGVLKGG